MLKLLLGYRDNMRVEVEAGIAVTAKTVVDLRTLPVWPDGLALHAVDDRSESHRTGQQRAVTACGRAFTCVLE
jgi:hypothetical protein